MRRHGVGEGAVHVTVRCAGTINASVGAHARTDAKTNKGSYLSVNQHRGHRRLRDAPDRPARLDQPHVFFRHTRVAVCFAQNANITILSSLGAQGPVLCSRETTHHYQALTNVTLEKLHIKSTTTTWHITTTQKSI